MPTIEFQGKTTGFDRIAQKIKGLASNIKSSLGDSKAMSGLFSKFGKLGTLLSKAGPVGAGIAVAGVGMLAMAAGLKVAFGIAKNLADTLDQIAKSARRTGISFENFQKMSFAAHLTGATPENVERAVRKFQKMWLDALANPKGRPASMMKALGLDIENMKGMSEWQRILTIANKLNTIRDRGLRSGMAQEMFGRGGAQLLPTFAGMGVATEIFDKMKLGIGDDALKAGEEFDDQLRIINQQFLAFGANSGIIEGFISAFRTLNVIVLDLRTNITRMVNAWDKFGKTEMGGATKAWAIALLNQLDPTGGLIGKYLSSASKRGQKLMPPRPDQPVGTAELGFQTTAGQVARSQKTFNNMGGFATAGMRAMGMNDPVISELQAQTIVLRKIADAIAPEATEIPGGGSAASRWRNTINEAYGSNIIPAGMLHTGGSN